MNRVVVTDSTADIPDNIIKKFNIKVLPVNVILNQQTYRDGIDISRADFYDAFEQYESMSTEPVRYEDYGLEFLQLVAKYDEILIIHCTKQLSKTYDTAVRVNRELNSEQKCKVEVMDSRQCSMGLGIIVIAAAEAMCNGLSFEGVVTVARKTRQGMTSYMAIPTLKYLRKNKKIGGARAFLGLAMGVKPVLEFNNAGKMVIKTKLFGNQKNMILSLIEKIKEDVGGRKITLAIIYSGNNSLVQNLKDVFQETFECKEIYVARFGPSIAINAGPESYAVFFIPH